jgi:hypothetical protein
VVASSRWRRTYGSATQVTEVYDVKYALLVYGDENEWAVATKQERKETYAKWGEFDQLLRKRNAATACRR